MDTTYQFTAKVWLYTGKGAWHFVTLPSDVATDIDYYFAHLKRGWGSLKVSVTLGHVTWQTSIFPDKKTHSYLLPMKSSVLKQTDTNTGDEAQLRLEIHTT